MVLGTASVQASWDLGEAAEEYFEYKEYSGEVGGGA